RTARVRSELGSRTWQLIPAARVQRAWVMTGCATWDEIESEMRASEQFAILALDVRDAYLEVPQPEPVVSRIQGQDFIFQKMVPGQREGTQQWFNQFYNFLGEHVEVEKCKECSAVIRLSSKPDSNGVCESSRSRHGNCRARPVVLVCSCNQDNTTSSTFQRCPQPLAAFMPPLRWSRAHDFQSQKLTAICSSLSGL
ncbi:unnamed protein product, partial [Symbiodinium sp. KB8]